MPVLLLTPGGIRTCFQDVHSINLSTGISKEEFLAAAKRLRPSGVVIAGMMDSDPIDWVCGLRRHVRFRSIPIAIVRSISELPPTSRLKEQSQRWDSILDPLSGLALSYDDSSGISGKLVIDQRARQVSVDGCRRVCSPQEFRLFLFFLRFPWVLFSRQELVWRISKDGESVDPRLIDVLVSRIRKKIAIRGVPAGRICALRGLGYAFSYNEAFFVDAITGSNFLSWPCSSK